MESFGQERDAWNRHKLRQFKEAQVFLMISKPEKRGRSIVEPACERFHAHALGKTGWKSLDFPSQAGRS
jgi:hypothetical protein